MVDPKDPHHNRQQQDELIADLYRASRGQDPAEVPPALDDLILSRAKQAVSEDNGARPAANNNVRPLRRRWEIPLSIAASLALVTLLYLNNKDELPPVLDTGIPEADYSETLNGSAPAPAESPMGGAQLEEIIVSPAAQAEQERRNRRGEKGESGESDAVLMEQAPSVKKSAPRAADSQVQQQNAPASSGLMDAPAQAPQTLKAERGIAAPAVDVEADAEQKEIASPEAQAWLQQIGSLWQQGERQQAKAQLAEFKARFPDYALDAFCAGYNGLCHADSE